MAASGVSTCCNGEADGSTVADVAVECVAEGEFTLEDVGAEGVCMLTFW